MINRNFTDEEIRKALECCASYDCNGCPLYSPTINCVIVLPEKALELVDRQRAERNEARNDYVSLIVDIKTKGVRDICDICKHQGAETDCCADCDDCYSTKCICRDCRDCDKWEWRGRNESQNT